MPVDIIAIPADAGSVLFLDKTVKGPGLRDYLNTPK